MARLPGFLRPRHRTSEVDVEHVRSPSSARLANIVGGVTADRVDRALPDDSVEIGQPFEAARLPGSADPAAGAEQPVGSRRPRAIDPATELAGVKREPGRPRVRPSLRPARAASDGATAPRGHRGAAWPTEEWRLRADAYILAQAFGTSTDAAPAGGGQGHDSPARPGEEVRESDASMPIADGGPGAAGDADAPTVQLVPEVEVPAVKAVPGRAEARPSAQPRHRSEGPPRGPRSRHRPVQHDEPKAKVATPPAAHVASCPYCGLLLEPPPSSSRACPRCRCRIYVKRLDGRTVYLAADALAVFDEERRRDAELGRWIRDRDRWLRLAADAGASGERPGRLAAAAPSAQVVEAARRLYLTTVERAFRLARADRRWGDAARIRRAQATAMFRAAGSPTPVPREIVDVRRDAAVAELCRISEVAPDAELVSAGCCHTCLADHGRVYPIPAELRTSRLPHPGCPKGLCSCRWELPAHLRLSDRSRRSRRVTLDEPGQPQPMATAQPDERRIASGSRASDAPPDARRARVGGVGPAAAADHLRPDLRV